MKFLHIADAHIDSPFKGLTYLPKDLWQSVYNSTYKAFEKAITQAIEQKVDFILVVGDTFDGPTPSLYAQKFVLEQFERLNEVDITVFMNFGNHDYYQDDNFVFDYPKNVQLFKSGLETKQFKTKTNKLVDITGFSYTQNHIKENIVNQFKAPNPTHYTIGMIHGAIATADQNNDNYAPFKLSELVDKNYNYYALGHIHKREVLCEKPLVVYSGNLQGRHINESGIKGCYLVEVDDNDFTTQLKFIETSQIIFDKLTVKLLKEQSLSELQNQIEKAMDLVETDNIKMMALVIQNSQFLSPSQHELISQTTYLEELSKKSDNKVVLYDVELVIDDKINMTAMDADYFERSKDEVLTSKVVTTKLKPLLKKYMPVEAVMANPEDLLKTVRQSVQLELNEAVVKDEEHEN